MSLRIRWLSSGALAPRIETNRSEEKYCNK